MTICIYHGNCADGFSGAWVVRRAYVLGRTSEFPIFHAGVYSDPPPDVAGVDVVLVDFSYKRPVLFEMAAVARSILILDHHKTAEADLVDLPDNVRVEFDSRRSGAMVAWDHYFPNEDPPMLLRYVEDRDLWRFSLPRSREINAFLFSHEYTFENWDRLMGATESSIDRMAEAGAAIERKHHKDIAELLRACWRRMKIGGHDVPAASLPYTMSSDAGHAMAQGEKFAACYWDTEEGRTFSLRSTDDGLDVSEIARRYGGGGHRNAAGFRLRFDELARNGAPLMPSMRVRSEWADV